jgi:hypothetical protein
MEKTTDYQSWLEGVSLRDEDDVYDLYDSLSNFEGAGRFYTNKDVKNDGYEYSVKAEGVPEWLFLESDEARFEFTQFLAANYTTMDEADVEKWYKLKTKLGRID